MTADRRLTLRDVAGVTGVSVSTASRALQGDPQISAATRERVQASAEALGYVPDLAARSLSLGASRTFGLLVPDATDPIHGSVVSGFEQAAHDAGYTTIIANSLGDMDRERRAIRGFAAHRVDGMALMGCYLDLAAVRATVLPSPVAFLNAERLSHGRRADLPAGCLRPDEESGVGALVAHLVERGCRRPAYVGFGRGSSNATRANAFVHEVTTRLGHDPGPAYDWRPDDRAGLAAELRAAGVDGVLGYDDRVALGLLDGFRSIGVAVPRDIAVAGFDDIPFAEISNPRLTTVVQPAAEMGAIAVAMLAQAIETGELAASTVLPVRLVVRESTQRPG